MEISQSELDAKLRDPSFVSSLGLQNGITIDAIQNRAMAVLGATLAVSSPVTDEKVP
jgi:hypothetical protein